MLQPLGHWVYPLSHVHVPFWQVASVAQFAPSLPEGYEQFPLLQVPELR
jgi:hypothetical protein